MIGALATGIYDDWDKCLSEWVEPLLGELEDYDEDLASTYNKLFENYLKTRLSLAPIWPEL